MRKRHRGQKGVARKTGDAHVERIFGVHAVCAAVQNPKRQIISLYATRNGHDRLRENLDRVPDRVSEVTPSELSNRLGSDTVHQGVMVEAKPLDAPSLESVVADAQDGKPILVLDQVTDPHNVGAILRSAAAFDACALIMTQRNSPPLDGTLAKAASGAVEWVPVAKVPNLARALEFLGKAGVRRLGLDGSADQTLEDEEPVRLCALVLGAEDKGLRRLTRENCDLMCRLHTPGRLKSLNVSNAAAVALHTLAAKADR